MRAFSLSAMRARAITASRDALTMLIGNAVLNEIPVSKREPRARAERKTNSVINRSDARLRLAPNGAQASGQLNGVGYSAREPRPDTGAPERLERDGDESGSTPHGAASFHSAPHALFSCPQMGRSCAGRTSPKRPATGGKSHLEKPMRLAIGAVLVVALTLMAAWNTVPPDEAWMGAR